VPGADEPTPSVANTPSFRKRFDVALLLGLPGIAALVGFIYVTTPPSAVPAGLSPSTLLPRPAGHFDST
jgi:hypothetical protein